MGPLNVIFLNVIIGIKMTMLLYFVLPEKFMKVKVHILILISTNKIMKRK